MNFKQKLITMIAVILVPIIINYGIMSWRAPGVYNGDWLAFFANYCGALIGVFGAYFIAQKQMRTQWKQVQNQRILDEEQFYINNRSYIYYQEMHRMPVKLKGVKANNDIRIIVTEDYEQWTKNLSEEKLKHARVPFYKICHRGNPEIIFDCTVRISLKNPMENNSPIELTANIGVIDKTEEIYVPLYSVQLDEIHTNSGIKHIDLDIEPLGMEIKYRTIVNEKMIFKYDVIGKKEIYYTIDPITNKEKEIINYDVNKSTWIYPDKIN
ncbi:TPA: hypothetical protein ROY06_004662 [Bacillus cereus]|nr:hypothetical protein [Bacillus cereus]